MSLRRSLFYSAMIRAAAWFCMSGMHTMLRDTDTDCQKVVYLGVFFIEAVSHSRHVVPRYLSTSGLKTAEKPHKMQEKSSTIIFSNLEGLLCWYLSLLSTSMPWISVDVHMYIGPNQVFIFWLICPCWSLKIVLHNFLGHCILNYL